MKRRWLMAILSLPVPVTVLIPAGLLFLFRGTGWQHGPVEVSHPIFWIGMVVGSLGLALAAGSASTFARFGDGTPAPWDPPRRFVAYGPYRFVRNPMILGVHFILGGECLLLRSWPLLGWLAVFVVVNSLYIPLIEEKGLGRRFGGAYWRYKARVPRWFPRRTPWNPDEETA